LLEGQNPTASISLRAAAPYRCKKSLEAVRMKFSVTNKKQTASFGIVGSLLAIAPLGLMLAVANIYAQAQTSADVSSATAGAAPAPSNWTQFREDNMQRWNSNETALSVGNVGNLQVKWKSPDSTKTSDLPATCLR
jgi:hypothetical protein